MCLAVALPSLLALLLILPDTGGLLHVSSLDVAVAGEAGVQVCNGLGRVVVEADLAEFTVRALGVVQTVVADSSGGVTTRL
jgi:hypothetical protein